MMTFSALVTIVAALATFAPAYGAKPRAQASGLCEIGKSFTTKNNYQFGINNLFLCSTGCDIGFIDDVVGDDAKAVFYGDWDVAEIQTVGFGCPTAGLLAGVCLCPGNTCTLVHGCADASSALLTIVFEDNPAARRAAAVPDETACVAEEGCCAIKGDFTLINARCGSTCNNPC